MLEMGSPQPSCGDFQIEIIVSKEGMALQSVGVLSAESFVGKHQVPATSMHASESMNVNNVKEHRLPGESRMCM